MKIALACAVFLMAAIGRAGVKDGLAALDRGDYQTAHKEFLRLAEHGDDKAMVTMGVMYHEGQGVKQDYDKAMDWYLKAFKKGNGDAYSNIGVMYRDGLGVKKNKNMAYCLFLITHVCSLGGESTQLRANSCLRRIVPEMTKEELVECFNYTHAYIKAYVTSKGMIEGIPEKYRPGKRQPALKDEPWWMKGELDFLTAQQPVEDARSAAPGTKPDSAVQKSTAVLPMGPDNEVTITIVNDGAQALSFTMSAEQIKDLAPGLFLSDSIGYSALGPGSNVTFNLLRGTYRMLLFTPDNMVPTSRRSYAKNGTRVDESGPALLTKPRRNGQPYVEPGTMILSDTPASRIWHFDLRSVGTNTVSWDMTKREDREFVPRSQLRIPESLQLIRPSGNGQRGQTE